MAVENVYIPKQVTNLDPKSVVPKSETDPNYWEKRKSEVRARREVLEEQKAMEAIENPPAPPEPLFKVSGGINLGNIDLQAEQRLAREEAEKMRQEKEAEIKELRQKTESLAEEKRQLEIKQVQDTMNAKLDALAQAITAGRTSQKSLIEQLNEAQTMATQLGFVRPSDVSPSTGRSPQLEIELMRLKMDEAAKEREFKRMWRNDEKTYELQVKKLEQEIMFKREELNRQKARDEMFAQMPQLIGGAIAAGLMEADKTGTLQRKESAPQAPASAPPAGNKVLAGPGESGVASCPKCKTEVAVGATATEAVCAGCGFSMPIERTKEAPVG
jgi:DNA repair exonuclease SbcCD ATPase subunit